MMPSINTANQRAQHQTMIAQLNLFIEAFKRYEPGAPGSNAMLQNAMRTLRMPSYVNMGNALAWAVEAIEVEQKALAFEERKEVVFVALKDAERHRRVAEKHAVRARKAWDALMHSASIIGRIA